MSKYTPGPWVTYESSERYPLPADVIVEVGTTAGRGRRDGAICEIYAQGTDGKYSSEVTNANARLIAAAPDLLEACIAWVAYFDRLAHDEEPGDQLAVIRNKFHGPRMEVTRAAIAKAEYAPVWTPPAAPRRQESG